jgi:hypothetical protein
MHVKIYSELDMSQAMLHVNWTIIFVESVEGALSGAHMES